jgi:uncharacterized membrane protein
MMQDRSPPEVARVAALSDGIFAIALTLLVVQIHLPELPSPATDAQLADALWAAAPGIFAYALSFLVIGRYWMAHRRIFDHVQRADHYTVRINLLFLVLVSFMPVPTFVLGIYGYLRGAVIFYAASAAATGLMLVLLSWYAHRCRTVDGGPTEPGKWLLGSWRLWLVPAFFLLSILLAVLIPAAVRVVWLLVPLTYVLPERVCWPWWMRQ